MNSFAIEPKLDGERMVIHYDSSKNNRTLFLTRNCNDYTSNYGPVMSPIVINNIHDDVESCILDGEMVAWDRKTDTFEGFGANRTIGREEIEQKARGEKPDKWLFYVIFDVLFLKHKKYISKWNGSITNLKLRERRKILENHILKNKNGEHKRFELIEHHQFNHLNDRDERFKIVMKYFDNYLLNRYEGLIIKDLDSTYVLGQQGK